MNWTVIIEFPNTNTSAICLILVGVYGKHTEYLNLVGVYGEHTEYLNLVGVYGKHNTT